MRLSLLLALALAGQSLIAVGELLDAAKLSHCGPDCPHSGATARLAASLRGTGAHRTLVYSLDVSCSSTHDAGGSQQGAAAAAAPQAALLQPLPPAVFADIYQLDNAAALGQGPAVKLFGPVDVESIERYSRPTLLAVYSGALAGGGSAAAAAEEVRGTGEGARCCW